MIFSCLLLHHRRLTHIRRHRYDVTVVFEIQSASVNLVLVGALNALKWCRAGDNVDGRGDRSKVYLSEGLGFGSIEEQ